MLSLRFVLNQVFLYSFGPRPSSLSQIFQPEPVFEPGRDSATLSRSLFECRTKINHPRHQVANKCRTSEIGTRHRQQN